MFDNGVLVAELVGTAMRLVNEDIRPEVAARLLRERAAERADVLHRAARHWTGRVATDPAQQRQFLAAAALLHRAADGAPA